MGRREAEETRQGTAALVQQARSGEYKRACEVGGAIFVPMALTPYGGWHKEDKDLAESWTRKTIHIQATGWGITSSTRGSNVRGEPGRARRTALSHSHVWVRRRRARFGSLFRRRATSRR